MLNRNPFKNARQHFILVTDARHVSRKRTPVEPIAGSSSTCLFDVNRLRRLNVSRFFDAKKYCNVCLWVEILMNAVMICFTSFTLMSLAWFFQIYFDTKIILRKRLQLYVVSSIDTISKNIFHQWVKVSPIIVKSTCNLTKIFNQKNHLCSANQFFQTYWLHVKQWRLIYLPHSFYLLQLWYFILIYEDSQMTNFSITLYIRYLHWKS